MITENICVCINLISMLRATKIKAFVQHYCSRLSYVHCIKKLTRNLLSDPKMFSTLVYDLDWFSITSEDRLTLAFVEMIEIDIDVKKIETLFQYGQSYDWKLILNITLEFNFTCLGILWQKKKETNTSFSNFENYCINFSI